MWQVEDNKFDFSISQTIDAPRPIVYQVLANFEAYPDFISDVASATRTGRDTYQMVVKAAILTIPARVRVTEIPDREVGFELVEGPVEVLLGKWQVDDGEKPGQTKVTLSVHMEATQRSEWLLRMAGKFVQSKTGKLVEAFQHRVEAVHRGEVSAIPAAQSRGGLTATVRRLWDSVTGKATPAVSAAAAPQVFTTAHQISTLDALAGTMIPPDDFDNGAQGLGFAEVAEVRARYESGRAAIYLAGLRAVDYISKEMYGKDNFVNLDLEQRTKLMEMVRDGKVNKKPWGKIGPGDFFGALWEDVLFLYSTHPDTWQRLGWPGPSFDTGGYKDFDQAQTFMGRN
jgi:ribosome-associated toxin RatA of RatAB toxin-antitoxin module